MIQSLTLFDIFFRIGPFYLLHPADFRAKVSNSEPENFSFGNVNCYRYLVIFHDCAIINQKCLPVSTFCIYFFGDRMRIREIPGSDKTGGSCHQLPPVLPPVATSRAQNKNSWSVHIPNRKLTEIDCVMTSTTLETIMSYFRACRLYLGYLLVANWWHCHQLPPVCHQFCHQLPPVSVLCPRETPHWKTFYPKW